MLVVARILSTALVTGLLGGATAAAVFAGNHDAAGFGMLFGSLCAVVGAIASVGYELAAAVRAKA